MRIVLGVTGGIAAYKAVLLLRLLREAGHSVRVIPTHSALKFVGAPTWEALSGQPVHTSVFDDVPGVEHVQLGQSAELIIVAPATADFIARMAVGRADDLLAATVLVGECPVVLAPAMHTQMWENPATKANVATLSARGVQIIGPAQGRLTGSDSGIGRMEEPDAIFAALEKSGWLREAGIPEPAAVDGVLSHDGAERTDASPPAGGTEPGDPVPDADRSLAGKTVVITAGGTREPIDPVRFIGNRSTGKQGIALAQAAANRGANVTLMSSNIDNSELEPIRNLATIIEVESAAQLQSAVEKAAAAADIVIMAAAVADFRPISVAESKVKKCLDRILTIELEENPDILKSLCANRKPGQVIVGFAAETGDNQNSVLDYGRKKAIAKGADLFAVNKVGHNVGFGTPDNEVWLLNKNGDQVGHAQGTKYQVAEAILSVAVQIAAIQTATIQL